jgi:hypothetical protein
VNKLRISTEAEAALVRIASHGDLKARTEVAHIIAKFKYFKDKMSRSPAYWNVGKSASGDLSSHATLKDGTSIWRLCQKHVHCIGLLAAMPDGDLYVLEICSKATVLVVEEELRKLAP